MEKIWHKSDNDWYLKDVSDNQVTELENTIYTLEVNPMTGELYLNNTGDKFKFDFKLYGLKSEFIGRTLKYYDNSTGNLGILLNGVKGTGKTITGKILANELENPIIVIGKKFGGITKFLSQIPTDLTIFIDEYDKIFDASSTRYNPETEEEVVREDSTLLSLMDGVFSGTYRRTFILTTNELYLNENMLNRPGRLRYKETFADLDRATVEEIIDDVLENKSHRECILEFIKTLKLISVDVVKAIVTEVNIFDEEPVKCCVSMNLEFLEDTYTAYDVTGETKIQLQSDMKCSQIDNFLRVARKSYKMSSIELNGVFYSVLAAYEEGAPLRLQEYQNKTAPEKRVIFVKEDPTHVTFREVPMSLVI